MSPSANAFSLITRFEGVRLRRYVCSAGYATIGYGHKILEHESFDEISTSVAQDLLATDINFAARAVERNIYLGLNQNQFDALVSFTYNVGGAALQRSVLRQKINYGELDQVAHEMLRWTYAKTRRLNGLVLRRKAEISLFYQ